MANEHQQCTHQLVHRHLSETALAARRGYKCGVNYIMPDSKVSKKTEKKLTDT